MFYLKHKGTKLEIREDNVYTRCTVCGKEHKVDLVAILSIEDADLYSTSVDCYECSAKRVAEMEEATHEAHE